MTNENENLLLGYEVTYKGKHYLAFASDADSAKLSLAFFMARTPLGRKRAQNKMTAKLIQDED
jgi:hypothetical protein